MSEGELVFPLKCSVQNYAWGKVGKESEVASLQKAADPSWQIDESTPYAELWMGTHVNCPSKVRTPKGSNLSLKDWITQHPEQLGDPVRKKFGDDLPFLFKVLSVNKSLSVQAHPNKVQAEKLHKNFPDVYKDDNHKPELAVALTPFKALCGFRPIKEVAEYLSKIEEFRAVVGGPNACKLISASKTLEMPLQREAMKDCFASLMKQDPEIIQTQLKLLINRLQGLDSDGTDSCNFESEVLFKLYDEFPGDVGCFTVYFLNVITLKPGESMFLEANLPHAYLSGDTMECMACSDNVVRAGLTPKFRDVHTLCEMLDYTGKPANKTKFTGKSTTEGGITVTTFSPPIRDFALKRFQTEPGCNSLRLPALPSPSISIVIQGNGTASNSTLESTLPVNRGEIFFTSVNQEITIDVSSESMLLFQAYAAV
ncbi:mannose-6-phosphate isomerase-like [Ostrea edulis]|uniref:mannose-6-phosphate isomerase-like n=1 Tax=Ostrea edulis TaxID=37623 RepID=UPI0024AF536A|nr:mannose-6-phosphate isomerase-like [Ostrea edulis]